MHDNLNVSSKKKKQIYGKLYINPRNDLYCVGWGIKLYSLTQDGYRVSYWMETLAQNVIKMGLDNRLTSSQII